MADLPFCDCQCHYVSPEEMATRVAILSVAIIMSFLAVWIIHKINNNNNKNL